MTVMHWSPLIAHEPLVNGAFGAFDRS